MQPSVPSATEAGLPGVLPIILPIALVSLMVNFFFKWHYNSNHLTLRETNRIKRFLLENPGGKNTLFSEKKKIHTCKKQLSRDYGMKPQSWCTYYTLFIREYWFIPNKNKEKIKHSDSPWNTHILKNVLLIYETHLKLKC